MYHQPPVEEKGIEYTAVKEIKEKPQASLRHWGLLEWNPAHAPSPTDICTGICSSRSQYRIGSIAKKKKDPVSKFSYLHIDWPFVTMREAIL